MRRIFMELDYTSIFKVFVDLIKTGTPVAIFLFLLDIMLNFFFSLAFPKHFSRRD